MAKKEFEQLEKRVEGLEKRVELLEMQIKEMKSVDPEIIDQRFKSIEDRKRCVSIWTYLRVSFINLPVMERFHTSNHVAK